MYKELQKFYKNVCKKNVNPIFSEIRFFGENSNWTFFIGVIGEDFLSGPVEKLLAVFSVSLTKVAYLKITKNL